jgi:enoyl-CoA hydratase
MDETMELAGSLARGALAAQAIAKRAIDASLDLPLADGLTAEQERFVEVFATDDAAIGVRSFLDQGPGKARFTGR